jgi:hypothetical protein
MADKKQIPVQIAVPIGAVAVAAICFYGYRTVAGPSFPKAPSAKELHSSAEQLALKSGGDFSKLTPDEQKMLDNMTLGHGKRFVEINYAKLSASGGK